MPEKLKRTVPVLLVAATVIPAGLVALLGARTLAQERDLERQRRRERLELAAGHVAISLERRLATIEERLAGSSGIRLTETGIEPDARLLYLPEATASDEPRGNPFSKAEELEFRHLDLSSATTMYRELANLSDLPVRAAALIRLGRVLRKQQNPTEALRAYARLADLKDTAVEGQPAQLLAHWGRCRVFEQSGDHLAVQIEVQQLAQVLYAGNLRVDAATFSLYHDLVRKWRGPEPPPGALARTEAANALWRLSRSEGFPPRGRRVLYARDTPVFAVWVGGPKFAVWLANPAELQEWLRPAWDGSPVDVSIQDVDGRPVFGTRTAAAVVLTPAETHLPFIIQAVWNSNAAPGDSAIRRNLLVSGLLVALTLMLAAGYGLYRATTRELALATQQSDFVSSVSHEFRTPLTSIRHLTELLASGKVADEGRKATYYRLLSQESERLHRMVEGLLSFGRMKAGAYAWKLEELDLSALVRTVVEDFRDEPAAASRQILVEAEANLPPIHADREALSRAVRNLIENAAKYSRMETPVHISVRREAACALIAVADQGEGVPIPEQKRVFQEFVRGAHAKASGVSGTGMGLALVKRIVEAHGGSVRLESEPGKGSTFTLVLPWLES